MGKKNRKRRRKQFIAVHAIENGNDDISGIVKEAKNRGVSQKKYQAREQRRQQANKKAIEQADATTEIFLARIPPATTAFEIVQAILTKLCALNMQPKGTLWNLFAQSTPTDSNFPVMRCEVKKPKNSTATLTANVSLKSAHYAEALIGSQQIYIKGCNIKVMQSKFVSVPGVGSAWRARPDPGSERWKVGMVQVGDKINDSLFKVFWSSSPVFDLANNCHAELNPVTSVLALTIGHSQALLKANATLQSLTRTNSMLRIEIPFRSILATPTAHTPIGSDKYLTACVPIWKPPRLYRAQQLSLNLSARLSVQPSRVWDCTGGSEVDVKWIRTVDPTPFSAFARAKAVRIFLTQRDLYQFFKVLHKQCLADYLRPQLLLMKTIKDDMSLSKHGLFLYAKQMFRVPFSIRYAVDYVLSTNAISVAAITDEFWKILMEDVDEYLAKMALDLMYDQFCDDEEPSLEMSSVQRLRKCIATCLGDEGEVASNVTGSNVSSEQHDVNGATNTSPNTHDDSDNFSMDSFDAEEFEVDMLMRNLNLDDIRDELERPVSVKSVDVAPALGSVLSEMKPKHHALIRRIIYTPTQCIATRPESDLLNRVLREFSAHMNRFLRVSFCDEDGGSVGHTGSNDILARVRIAMRDGVLAAGEKFVFLAFSNSQLRDHSAWFYNETPYGDDVPPTANDIREWMGDFSHIRVPGKYAARQGQAFSSTVGTTVLTDFQYREKDDIYDLTQSYAFSDGVGVMSSRLAKDVAKKLGLRRPEQIPSAFQIRFSGAKGMLTVWDAALPHDGGVDVVVRQSMKKFESTHRALEVVGYSKQLPLFLNRQIIMLLSVMGVPDLAFERLQSKLLSRLNKAMQHDGAHDALTLLYSSGCCSANAKLSASAPMMGMASFFQAGLTCVNSEHVFNLMEAFRKRTIRELMNRTRIPIDSDKGVSALGVMDELGVLNDGEVFVQYTDPISGERVIVNGPVTVGRSPCLHPGDIQPLHAVDRESLRHLVNVIVFPQVGIRPIPSKLSGGDLDGDIYFCLFHEELQLHTLPYPAMNYKAPTPVKLNHPIQASDVADFFVEYIRNDNLGQIANAHVVHGDKEHKGAESTPCLRLAQLHSTAVDFAKTGVPAELPMDLQPRNVANQYPDFMGKHPKVTYKSNKVLGKLYRQCYTKQAEHANPYRYMDDRKRHEIDAIIESIPHHDMLDEAIKICVAYNYDLSRIMDEFGVKTEGELVSGQVLSFSARHAQLRGRREYFSLQMRMNRKASELKSAYRDIFFDGLGQASRIKHSAESIAKACAWYEACQKVADESFRAGNVRLVSFPWVVTDVLLPVISSELKVKEKPMPFPEYALTVPWF